MDCILVTGGAGYIGAHVCKALARAGFLPVTYDNLSTGHAYAVKWGPLVHAELLDEKKLNATLEKYQPKAVCHFAASALVPESIVNPGKYYQNNLNASVALLNAMQKNRIFYLVFSSSCAVYGESETIPLTEAHFPSPKNPYGKSKLMVEQLLSDFERAHSIRSIALRYFNAAGADFDAEVGEDHDPETHLIPLIIRCALGIQKEIVVYGTNFSSHDGSAIRDYIHVQDLAEAHVKALQWLVLNNKSAQINLGSGAGHSVFEIIKAIETFCGKPIAIRVTEPRLGEPAKLIAANVFAQEVLQWSPRFSTLPQLVETAWKWQELLLTKKKSIR